MDLKAECKRLMEVLALKRAPIAVTYTNEAQPGDGKSRSACGALWDVYQGNVVVVTPETSACPGGQWYLGLAKSPREGLEDFLVNIEHIFASLPCARSFLATLAAASGRAGRADRVRPAGSGGIAARPGDLRGQCAAGVAGVGPSGL